MRIVSFATLREFFEVNRDTEAVLRDWAADVKTANWETPGDVKQYASSVTILSNDRVCFNIKGNQYRLVVSVNYETKTLFVKFIGTHQEYMKVNVETVKFKGGDGPSQKGS